MPGERPEPPRRVQRRNRFVVLGGAGALVVGMTAWGSAELFAPFPGTKPAACSKADEVVTRTLTRSDVVVSIYNAGSAPGTAGRFSTALTRLGFKVATVGNAPAGVTVPFTEIVGPTMTDPATRLVADTFGATATVTSDPSLSLGPGVNVFIGPHHRRLVKHPPRSIKLSRPITTCLTG